MTACHPLGQCGRQPGHGWADLPLCPAAGRAGYLHTLSHALLLLPHRLATLGCKMTLAGAVGDGGADSVQITAVLWYIPEGGPCVMGNGELNCWLEEGQAASTQGCFEITQSSHYSLQ